MDLVKLSEKLGFSEDKVLEALLMLDPEYSEDSKILEKTQDEVKAYLEKSSSEDSKVEEQDDVESIGLQQAITIKNFAEIIDVPLVSVMTALVNNGFMLNLNSQIDFDIASIIAEELGKKVHLIEEGNIGAKSEIEEIDLGELLQEKDKSKLVERAPIVSVIGHVDHGKTSLLDYIRESNVVSKEAGAITQSIGAYQAKHKDREITFLDTPGHEAFVAMRRRGVRATDIAILVIAADDGIKAQTVEAIHHAKEAGLPVVVAITKVDKPEANPARVKEQLTEHNLLLEEWGGNTIAIEVSSKTGKGIDDLLESILLLSDVAALKANPDRSAIATVIESNLDKKLGAVATVVVHTGTLKARDVVVIGDIYGKVRSLLNHKNKTVNDAGPSTPVLLTGLNSVPQVGDILKVVPNERMAKNIAKSLERKREEARKNKESLDIELITHKVAEQKKQGISVIIRTDSEGSLEAIRSSLAKIKTKNAKIKIIRGRTGDVVVSDVNLAQISDAVIVAFNVKTNQESKQQAQDEGVNIAEYNVIYKLVDDLTARLLESIKKEYDKIELGSAEVLQIFLTKKDFMIAGINLTKGKVSKGCKATVTRANKEIGDINVPKVQLMSKEVTKVEAKAECGIRVEKLHIKEGDKLEFFTLQEKKIELIK